MEIGYLFCFTIVSRRSLQLTFVVLVFVGLVGCFCCFLAGELIFDLFLTF